LRKQHGRRRLPSGIEGLDEIADGGLPSERVTLVMGGAGNGKTIFGLQSLAAGARLDREAGLFVTFEESAESVIQNVSGFDWQVDRLIREKRLVVLDARLRESVVVDGEFDLLGLLAVIGAKAKSIDAKRIVLDGIDVLLAYLGNSERARREVFRMKDWLETSGLTTILTAKDTGDPNAPAHEYEYLQFIADCVVTLQHRVVGSTASRFLRVAKYRGAAHSANELPFSIGKRGIELAYGPSNHLSHPPSFKRLSTGISRLDAMLRGGYYQGSCTLVTGAPGTSKTTLSAAFAEAASKRKERTLFVSFDEAPEQIVRNVASVGIRLSPHVESGLLLMRSLRSRAASPEAHVAQIRSLLREHRADNLVIDPISALGDSEEDAAAPAAIQIIDLAKSLGVTSMTTSLLGTGPVVMEKSPIGISTIADTWIHLTYVDNGGERNRALTIIKSRGTGHANQLRELILSDDGVTLADVYTADGKVLMGTLRWQEEVAQLRTQNAQNLEATLREKEAELALAETVARAQTIASEQAVREIALQRLQVQRRETAREATAHTLELRRRRRADPESKTRLKSVPKTFKRAK
jgi:circadian clock protein KaiC